MSTIAVTLPEEDLTFLREWSAEQGMSAEDFLAQQAHHLRQHIQRKLHPVVQNATGIISPSIDARQAYLEHVESRHQ